MSYEHTRSDKFSYYKVQRERLEPNNPLDEAEKEIRIQVPKGSDEVSLIGSLDPSSLNIDDEPLHRLLIDVDMNVECIPSRTPGHYHLIFPEMPATDWEHINRVLQALAAVGVVQQEYADVCNTRQMAFLRASNDVMLPEKYTPHYETQFLLETEVSD